ncbi:MAG: hypothetical protein U0231_15045 [Nitrospiraceae bacterium]
MRAFLVHNGIIEKLCPCNKQQLHVVADGAALQSETDTEVVAHLIDKYIQKKGLHLADAVRAAAKEIRGSYAITVISEREPGLLLRRGQAVPWSSAGPRIPRSSAPMMAMLSYTRDVTFLEEGDVADDVVGHQVHRHRRPACDAEGNPR